MKFTGQHTLHAPVERVWDALLDPAVLVRTIPGCERLEELPDGTEDHAYAMTVTAGVAAIKGTYTGSCTLADLRPHDSLVMQLNGAGAPGTIGATVQVRFAEVEAGTEVSYDADAIVGGMLGGVGQRMLTSVSRRMAGEFFTAVDGVLAGAVPPGQPEAGTVVGAGAPGMPAVYTDARPGRASSPTDFWRGVALGAGLVALGVLVGRRR